MTDTAFILRNCAQAFSGSEEAVHLFEQKSRLEQAVSGGDPALTLDTAKALLESVFKTIISDRVKSPDLTKDIVPLYGDVRSVLVFNGDHDANEILKKLGGSIVHNVAELRNKYGAASHGDDGFYSNPIEMLEAEMVAHIVDSLSGFLFRKHKHLYRPEFAQRIYYADYEEFNDWIDSQHSPIKLPVDSVKEVPMSVFLFKNEVEIYREMLLQYLSTEKEDSESDRVNNVEVGKAVKTGVLFEPMAEYLPRQKASSSEENIRHIMECMVINDEVRASITDDNCRNVALFVEDYALNKAGVDWENRDPMIAKFRNHIKRKLIQVSYSEAFMAQAIDRLIEMAKDCYPSSRVSG